MNLWTTHTLRMPAILGIALLLTIATGTSERPHAASAPRVEWDAGLDEEDEDELVGFDGHGSDSTRPKVEAFFTSESYPRGGSAHLVIADHARNVSVRVFHAG